MSLTEEGPEISLTEADTKELQVAKSLLENPGIAARITEVVGKPIEKGLELLPDGWNEGIAEVTQVALLKAVDAALFTMKDIPGEEASDLWHKAIVAVSGGAGGFFGLKAVAIELPISTTIMLRSIADIAREQGESISSIETKMACLEVLALGGKGSFQFMRSALAKEVTQAAEFLVTTSGVPKKMVDFLMGKGFTQKAAELIAREWVTRKTAPALVRAIPIIAERYAIQISQKMAAQAVPLIGAAGGAIINTMFMDHFQDQAKGYFIYRKLERRYSVERVKEAYDALPETDTE